MKQTETTNQQQENQDMPKVRAVFDWKTNRKNVWSGIKIFAFIQFVIAFMGLFMHMLHSGSHHDQAQWAFDGMLAVGVLTGILMPLMTTMEFIVFRSLTTKYIQAWQKYAEDVAQEKLNIAERRVFIGNHEQDKLFEATLKWDKKFMESYEGSTHEEQLKVFEYAMAHSYTFFGRLISVLLPYSFWENRMMANAAI